MNKAGLESAVMRLYIAAHVRKNWFTQVYDGAIGHNARRLSAGARHGSRNTPHSSFEVPTVLCGLRLPDNT